MKLVHPVVFWSNRGVVHTVKPLEEAQTLVPSELKMAALSMLPVATRLELVSDQRVYEAFHQFWTLPGVDICYITKIISKQYICEVLAGQKASPATT